MSWRALIVLLLLALVASWQGGQQLGHWLVAQAPESIASAFNPQEDRNPVLDADGRPYAPQPPQPRIDGTLGVPREMTPVEWTITPVIASGANENSYRKENGEDNGGDEDNPDPSDTDRTPNRTDANAVGTIDVSQSQVTAPVRAPPVAPVVTETWQQSFKKELARCGSLGFFQRPGCIDSAQNKFCGPNNAWGKLAECPSRANNPNSGG
jgi:hypothetical protein